MSNSYHIDRTVSPVLQVKNLSTYFDTSAGIVKAVQELSYSLWPGEILGIVGESGCGKSVSSQSIMQLISTPPGRYANGEILFQKENLLDLTEKQMRRIRGNRISMISQDPMTSLNPVMTIGKQISETIKIHQKVNNKIAYRRTLEMLRIVQIPEPKRRFDEYPHQLSGGMRQRVMIALALACEPDVLIADEPTTALDVTIQAQILQLIKDLRNQSTMAVILISHDLGVIAECCDRVIVMYAGRKVESASVNNIFKTPAHPYTKLLFASMPKIDQRTKRLKEIPGIVPALINLGTGCSFAPRCQFSTKICINKTPKEREILENHTVSCFEAENIPESLLSNENTVHDVGSSHAEIEVTFPRAKAKSLSETNDSICGERLLQVRDLKKHFIPSRRRLFKKPSPIHAVNGVSFEVNTGETLSLVGESGSGKSTTGKSILQLVKPSNGSVIFSGSELVGMQEKQMRPFRRDLQVIYQDPYASLNPRMTAGQIVLEPLRNFPSSDTNTKSLRKEMLAWIFKKVGLRPEAMTKYPHEFSGGQRQRIGIARALAVRPKLIVCDEPVSALDVSVQAKIINLLNDLQAEMQVAYLFIAHDLSVVHHISDRVAVMYLGEIVEIGNRGNIYSNPMHPYTEALLSAVPTIDLSTSRQKQALQGDPPSPAFPPSGCPFHTRCPLARAICKEIKPVLSSRESNYSEQKEHKVACHFR